MALDLDSPRFYGGRACLDFANTVEPRVGHPQHDHLREYTDVVRWARHAGLISARIAGSLHKAAGLDSDAAIAAFTTALTLREATYQVFSAVVGGRQPTATDLTLIKQAAVNGLHHAELSWRTSSFAWVYPPTPHLHRPLWPVAESAVALLTSPDLARVKTCPGACAWLFLDTTKNRHRKWCSMQECGSEAKILRQAERRRAARRPAGTAHAAG